MNRPPALRQLLLIIALVGVVMAPLGQAIAAPMMAAESVAAMAGDMPCCPDEPALPMDCADCPLVALCVAGLGGVVLPESNPVGFGALISVALAPGESFALSSLAGAPPSRPPKI